MCGRLVKRDTYIPMVNGRNIERASKRDKKKKKRKRKRNEKEREYERKLLKEF